MAQGGVEKLGLPGSFLKLTMPNGEKVVLEKDMPEHTIAVEFIRRSMRRRICMRIGQRDMPLHLILIAVR